MPAAELAAPPGRTVAGARGRAGDRLFSALLAAFGALPLFVVTALGWTLAARSAGAWRRFGPSFLWGTTWDPVKDAFGALPFIYGTLVSSLVALLIAVPLGVGSAIFLAELAPRRVSEACAFLIELLAAIPSVILGLMGIFLLVPAVRAAGAPYGVGMLSASLTLSLMILPYIAVIARQVLLGVPRPLKEAMLALGATRWETVRWVSLPYARAGIAGAVFLSLGRALGETMAVTMVIGNTPKISASLLAPSYTMAAVIANELAEAAGDLHLQSLIAIGAALLLVTVLVNGVARLMLRRLGGARGRG